MERDTVIKKQIKEQGILPLFYHDSMEVCIAVTNALYQAGIRSIEFTNRGANAFENFKLLVQQRDKQWQGLLLAIGTIKSVDEANKFFKAGADFLISPVFDSEIFAAAQQCKVLWIPGCTTPTEIYAAEKAGCTMIKLFPGNLLMPSFVEAIKPLFPQIDFLVTGGVDITEDNLKAWFKSGVVAVGMGSKLITSEVLKNELYTDLKITTEQVLSIVNKIKAD